MGLAENINTAQTIQSDLYGEMIVDNHQIYQFPQGLVGMSQLNKFALLPYEDTELFVLQSFQEEMSLMLIPTTNCSNKASFMIDEHTVAQLGMIEQDEIVTFFVFRFINDDPYVNVRAPIVIVPRTQKGCQYIIQDDSLSVREPLVLLGDDTC